MDLKNFDKLRDRCTPLKVAYAKVNIVLNIYVKMYLR